MTVLTDRFTRAVDYARIAHTAQVRKGSQMPYLYHPIAVASLVIEFGGSEDQAIAGLLHDVVEDCGAAHAAFAQSGVERNGQAVISKQFRTENRSALFLALL